MPYRFAGRIRGGRLKSGSAKRVISTAFHVMLVVAWPGGASAIDYYVSERGNDANSGRSAVEAWRTISRVNRVALAPGDRVLLKGGESFAGTLYLDSRDSGSPHRPILITSYGSGHATILPGSGDGIWAYNTAGIAISNLDFAGISLRKNWGSGVYFYTDVSGAKLDDIVIDHVTVSGFKNGIEIGAAGNGAGFANVTVAHSVTRDNRENGITVWGNVSPGRYSHSNVRIKYCRSYGNSGPLAVGNGIVVSSVDGAVIERSIAHDNGGRNLTQRGPVGIWAWQAKNVVIQHNESYHNQSNQGGHDGNGFNLDGGVTNSVLQYNYSHGNDGAGFVLAQYKNASVFGNNVIRYNISETDGRRNYYSGIYLWSADDYGISDSSIYNNTVYASPTTRGVPAGISVVSKTHNVTMRNNIIVTAGGLTLLHVEPGQHSMKIQGNAYWSSGASFRIEWYGEYYHNLQQFRETGQERLDQKAVGYNGDPGLVSPGHGGTVNNPRKVDHLNAYRLRSTSQLISRGLDLPRAFGEDVGHKDYYGTSIPSGAQFEPGAYEAPAILPKAHTTMPHLHAE